MSSAWNACLKRNYTSRSHFSQATFKRAHYRHASATVHLQFSKIYRRPMLPAKLSLVRMLHFWHQCTTYNLADRLGLGITVWFNSSYFDITCNKAPLRNNGTTNRHCTSVPQSTRDMPILDTAFTNFIRFILQRTPHSGRNSNVKDVANRYETWWFIPATTKYQFKLSHPHKILPRFTSVSQAEVYFRQVLLGFPNKNSAHI